MYGVVFILIVKSVTMLVSMLHSNPIIKQNITFPNQLTQKMLTLVFVRN